MERRAADDHRVQGCAQSIDVGGRTDFATIPPRLLGRHVARRAHDLAAGGQSAVAQHLFGEPEVGDAGSSTLVEKDVARLEIAMDHTSLVGILDGLGDFEDERGRRARGQRAFEKAIARLFPSTNPMLK